MPFSNRNNEGSLEREPIPGLKEGNDKVCLEYPLVPESKEVLKEGWGQGKSRQDPA